MKHLIFFTFFLVLFAKNMSHSQDMRPGYIVLVSNDTLQGYVQYQPNDQLADGFNFSEKENGSIIRYSPDQVKFFRYEQDKLMMAKEKYFEEDEYRDHELVFYEEIIKGKASLFKLGNAYFLQKDTSFVRLENKKQTISNENGTFEKESKDYLKVLGYYLADCPSLREQIFEADLSEKSLTRLVRKYNECQESDYIFYKGQKAGFKLEYAPYVGYELTFFDNAPGGYSHYYLEGNPDYSGLQLGLKTYIMNPRLSENFALSAGIGFLSWSADYSYSVRKTFQSSIRNRWEHSEIDIEMIILEIPVGIQYRVGGSKSIFYLNAGASLNFILSQSFRATHIWEYDNEILGTVVQPDNPAAWPDFLLTFSSFQPYLWIGPQVIVPYKSNIKLFFSSDVKFGSFVIDNVDRFQYSSTFIGLDLSLGVIF